MYVILEKGKTNYVYTEFLFENYDEVTEFLKDLGMYDTDRPNNYTVYELINPRNVKISKKVHVDIIEEE